MDKRGIEASYDRVADEYARLARVLRPGGVLLLAFHVGEEILHRDELWGCEVGLDFVFFRREQVERTLRASGFEVEDAVERDTRPAPRGRIWIDVRVLPGGALPVRARGLQPHRSRPCGAPFSSHPRTVVGGRRDADEYPPARPTPHVGEPRGSPRTRSRVEQGAGGGARGAPGTRTRCRHVHSEAAGTQAHRAGAGCSRVIGYGSRGRAFG